MRLSTLIILFHLVQFLNTTWAYYVTQQGEHTRRVLVKVKDPNPRPIILMNHRQPDSPLLEDYYYDSGDDFDYIESPSNMQLHHGQKSQTKDILIPVMMTSDKLTPIVPIQDDLPLYDYYEFGGPPLPPDYGGGGGWYGPGPPPGPPPQSKPPIKGKPKPKPKPKPSAGGNYGPPPFEGGGGWSEGPAESGGKEKDKFSEIKDKWNGLLEKLKLKDKGKDKDKDKDKKPVVDSKPPQQPNPYPPPSGPGWGPPPPPPPPSSEGPGWGWGPPQPPPSRPLNLLEIWIGGLDKDKK